MNYDRLLQLGGIDREVPPIPQYISKEELKKWQDDQEKEIPDDVIKGIKEVEDFLAGTPDNETLVGSFEAKGAASDATTYKDVYIGSGTTYLDAMIVANHQDEITKGAMNPVTLANTYLWVILPSAYVPTILMEGVVVPTTEQSSVTVGNVTYKVFQSDNTYTGTFNIILI